MNRFPHDCGVACWTAAMLLIGGSFCPPAPAEGIPQIDTRPLAVELQPAFVDARWPDFVTGQDSGKATKPFPIIITSAGDGTDDIYIAEQRGSLHRITSDPLDDNLALVADLTDRVSYNDNENEEGLLGVAFHPNFANNRQVFIYYTAQEPLNAGKQSIISRFTIDADGTRMLDPESEHVILRVDQPYWNHNGGTIIFGPDGYLYVGLGDGGAFNDPHMNGQNLRSLLGSLLRIDVDHPDRENGREYGIPSDNPFVGGKNFARPEIYAYGLRNVWRVTFDRQTNVCWAADVGQNLWEEINIITPGGNYGWRLREGKHQFGPFGSKPRNDLIEPIWEYGRDVGKSITGGYVYRGKEIPELQGAYLYGDYVTGAIWALWYDFDRKRVIANRPIQEKGGALITFGEDANGEIFLGMREGTIFRLRSAKQ